jgi:hypothetical protein
MAERSRVSRGGLPRGLVVGGVAAVVAIGAGVLLGKRRGYRA